MSEASKHQKFPSIPHLPWSQEKHRDDSDMVPEAAAKLIRSNLVVTEKMDGENISMYCDRYHARSLAGTHDSRDFAATLHARIKFLIPTHYQVVGEYLFAVHSVKYESLSYESVYQVICVIDHARELLLSWDETVAFAQELGLPVVPLIGEFPEGIPEGWVPPSGESSFGPTREGFVVRDRNAFPLAEFDQHIAKWVRKGHVQGDHWMVNWKPFNKG